MNESKSKTGLGICVWNEGCAHATLASDSDPRSKGLPVLSPFLDTTQVKNSNVWGPIRCLTGSAVFFISVACCLSWQFSHPSSQTQRILFEGSLKEKQQACSSLCLGEDQ